VRFCAVQQWFSFGEKMPKWWNTGSESAWYFRCISGNSKTHLILTEEQFLRGFGISCVRRSRRVCHNESRCTHAENRSSADAAVRGKEFAIR
jgi:hypothetical protein